MRWIRGGVFGVLAYLAGLILVVVLLGFGEGAEFTFTRESGSFFHETMFAPMVIPEYYGPEYYGPYGEYLMRPWFGGVPAILYILTPVTVLVVAGYAVARMERPESGGAGATAGATITAGFGSLVLLVTLSIGFSLQQVFINLVIAGIAYPLTFGAIGGTFAGRWGRSGDTDESDRRESIDVYCPACGNQQSATHTYCGKCGENLPHTR